MRAPGEGRDVRHWRHVAERRLRNMRDAGIPNAVLIRCQSSMLTLFMDMPAAHIQSGCAFWSTTYGMRARTPGPHGTHARPLGGRPSYAACKLSVHSSGGRKHVSKVLGKNELHRIGPFT